MRKFWTSAFIASCLMAGAAFAQETTAPAAPIEAAAAEDPKSSAKAKKSPGAGDPDEVVCKSSAVTGTRAARRRTCMTRAEWAQTARDAQNDLSRTQNRGTYSPNSNPVGGGPGG